jgi:hypothetical protein
MGQLLGDFSQKLSRYIHGVGDFFAIAHHALSLGSKV